MAVSQSWWKPFDNEKDSQQSLERFEAKPLNLPGESEPEKLVTRRIYLLGVGSIGTLIAHSLKCLPNPPIINLLLHRSDMYEEFKSKGRTIRLIDPKSDINDEQTGYDVDVLGQQPETDIAHWKFLPDRPKATARTTNLWNDEEKMSSGELYIYCLIVTVKGPGTVRALRSIKHRVNEKTTICLMQNGMGQIDELNREIFTDPQSRPTYMLGIISHGAHMSGSFNVIHAGLGTVALGIYRDTDKYPLPPKSSKPNSGDVSEEDRKRMYPTDEELYSNMSSRYLLRTLTRSPVLACAAFPYLDLLQLQLEKLSANAILNPLTALLDVPNGSILNDKPISQVQRLLLAEISLVIRSLPELEAVPSVQARFSPSRLETLLTAVTQKTALNSSSMREDMRHNRYTEIDYINGYIVKRGEEQGLHCVLNYMLMQLVKGKLNLQTTSESSRLPYGTNRVQSNIRRDETGEPLDVTLEDTGTPAKGERY